MGASLELLPLHRGASTDPPSNSLSQPVSGQGNLYGSKSGIQGNEGVNCGAERAMEGSPLVREKRHRVLAPGCENRVKDSTNAKPDPTASRAQDVLQSSSAPQKAPGGRTPLIAAAAGMVTARLILLTPTPLDGRQDQLQDTPQINPLPQTCLSTNSIFNHPQRVSASPAFHTYIKGHSYVV